KPSARGSFLNVLNTPLQLLLRGLSLMETVGKLRPDRAGDPIHNEDVAAGKFFGPIQYGNRLLYPSDSAQQRNRVRMLRSQQGDHAQIERLLRIRETRLEIL